MKYRWKNKTPHTKLDIRRWVAVDSMPLSILSIFGLRLTSLCSKLHSNPQNMHINWNYYHLIFHGKMAQQHLITLDLDHWSQNLISSSCQQLHQRYKSGEVLLKFMKHCDRQTDRHTRAHIHQRTKWKYNTTKYKNQRQLKVRIQLSIHEHFILLHEDRYNTPQWRTKDNNILFHRLCQLL